MSEHIPVIGLVSAIALAGAGIVRTPPPSVAADRSVSPDGKTTYVCGDERESHSGCYTHWARMAGEGGRWDDWSPGWCPTGKKVGGMCWGGGVAWWYWNGEGRIGDPVLKDFWVRDYANLDGRSNSPENSYGDARRLPGDDNCYQAREFRVCMVEMIPQ